MKQLSNPISSKFIACTIVTVSIAAAALAQGSSGNMDLSLLGNLAKNHANGDYRYSGASHFVSNGNHNYINQFARKMAQGPGDIPVYEDVLTRLVAVWEIEQKQRGFDNDLAPAFAYYTMVNEALATNQPYGLSFFDNMVAQNRKAFCSAKVARMSNAKKQDMYDYMITQSAFMQAMASAGRERNFAQNEELLASIGNSQIESTFSYQPSRIVIADLGVSFQ